ncbi:MAG: hypothetical protein GTO76_09360 [Planctomycetales bacterium]|nr:hypothetical protein [Planctomycetales bacterium]NIN08845.1 hypothetical protein [Planctomycetales bacterium]NIN77962.1 hypothetical protein [Planctomycetales bacterium]NIO35145.1 hypothetical protein [Planctomycetales bacterium]NIO46900.1 hypothetical protein [Planctomycetales bacterium]
MIFRLDHIATALIAIFLLAAAPGCSSLRLSSVPLLDKLAFWERQTVPPEILARHGPTATERLAQIEKMGRQAAKGSPSTQQQIAANLAQQISVEQNPLIRLHLIQAISRCRVPVASAVLRAGLEDKDLDVQQAACAALGDRPDPETTTLLGAIVSSDSEPLDLRLAAIDTLGRLDNPAAALALAPALEPHVNPALQFRAVTHLKKITGLDHGNDLVAWRNYFARMPATNSRSPTAPYPGLENPTVGAFSPQNGPPPSPAAQVTGPS